MRNTTATIVALLAAPLWAGCGGSEPSPETPADARGPKPRSTTEAPSVQAEIGALDSAKVNSVFEAAVPDLRQCLNDGAERVEFIGGDVHFFLKIDSQGAIEHAHLEQSSLGDRETEKCMLDALRDRDWPSPQGGKTGLARKSFDFDPPNDVRPPAPLSYDHIQDGLAEGELASAVDACKRGISGSFTITMYIGTEGEVLAAGAAPPDEAGEASVDCVIATLRDATFPPPGSWPGKVQFTL